MVIALLIAILIVLLLMGGSKLAFRLLVTLAIAAGAVLTVLWLFAPVTPT